MNKSGIIGNLMVFLLLILLTSCGENKREEQSGKVTGPGTENTADSMQDDADSLPSVEADPDQEYAVIVSTDPSETELTAADMLAEYLSELFGKECPRIDESVP